MALSEPIRDAERQQLLAGWQRIAQGLIDIKATKREIRTIRSLLSSRLGPVAAILGIHTCLAARAVVSSGGNIAKRGKNRMDGVGYLHLRGKNPPTWYVNFTVKTLSSAGKMVRQRVRRRIGPATELTEQQARALKNEILVQAEVVPLRVTARPIALTVAEFVAQSFMPEHVTVLKKAGQLHYKTYLKNHVLPGIGALRLRDVAHDDIQHLIRLKQQAKPKLIRLKEEVPDALSPQSLRHIRNVCSAVFRLAIVHKLHPGPNPAQYVRLPEMKRQAKRALTLEECRVLLPALATPVQQMALLSICSSMNFAEMAGLVWRRVNLTPEPGTADGESLPAHSLAVRQNYYGGEYGSVKAESRQRIVPMPIVVVEALQRIKSTSKFTGPDDPVFSNKAGRPQTIANLNKRILKPTAERLDMGWVSWHAFRRTHATLMDQANVAIVDRIAGMGHSSFAMTLKYTSADIERRRGSVEQVSALVLEGGQREPNENQVWSVGKGQ